MTWTLLKQCYIVHGIRLCAVPCTSHKLIVFPKKCLTRSLRESVRIRSFSGPNAAKYGLEKLRIRTLFTQCITLINISQEIYLHRNFNLHCCNKPRSLSLLNFFKYENNDSVLLRISSDNSLLIWLPANLYLYV